MATKDKKTGHTLIAKNRSVYHDYDIDEKFEAGIVLTGTEVRSLRERNAQLTDAFCIVRKGEVWLVNVHISPYSHGNIANVDPDRRRKLLLHRKEIRYLEQKVQQKGYAIPAIALYFDERNRVKVLIGVGRGKKEFDKRADMAKRDSQRDIERVMKDRSRM